MMDSYSTSYGANLRYRTATRYVLDMECCSGYEDPAGGLNCGRKRAYLTVYVYNYYYYELTTPTYVSVSSKDVTISVIILRVMS